MLSNALVKMTLFAYLLLMTTVKSNCCKHVRELVAHIFLAHSAQCDTFFRKYRRKQQLQQKRQHNESFVMQTNKKIYCEYEVTTL